MEPSPLLAAAKSPAGEPPPLGDISDAAFQDISIAKLGVLDKLGDEAELVILILRQNIGIIITNIETKNDCDEVYKNATYQNFVASIIPAAVEKVLKQRHPKPELRESLSALLRSSLDLVIASMEAALPELMQILGLIFNYTFKYYLRNPTMERQSSDDDQAEDATPEWRASIGFSDWIDAIFVDPYSSQREWRRAQIVEEVGTCLQISFENMMENYDLTVPRDSPDIAPQGTKTKDQLVWRRKLAPGTLVDCMDPYSHWYNGTVLDMRLYNGQQEFKIGYRVYTPSGPKEDGRGRFVGWGENYDEWVSWRSAKLAPFGTKAKGPGGASGADDFPPDEDDPIGVCAVYRVNEKYGSREVVDLLNYFASEGGFDKIISVLRNYRDDRRISVKFVLEALHAIEQPLPLYALQFAIDYLEEFKDALQESVLTLHDSEFRNLDKGKLDTISSGLERLLRRVYKEKSSDVARIVEGFQLDFTLKCLQSSIMERQLQGLKLLLALVAAVSDKETQWLEAEFVIAWIRSNNLIKEIYGSHPQLIRLSNDLLRFLCDEHALRFEDLDAIWAACLSQSEESSQEVLKLEYLTKKVADVPPAEFRVELVTLLVEWARTAHKGLSPALIAIDLLVNIIDEKSEYPERVVKPAESALISIMQIPALSKHRIIILENCVERIKNGESVAQNLVTLRSIIETYPVSGSYNPVNQDYVVSDLVRTHDLVSLLIEEVIRFEKQAKEFAKSPARRIKRPGTPSYPRSSPTSIVSGDKVEDLTFGGRIPYLEQLKIRLSLLRFVLSKSQSRFKYEHVERLWEAIYSDSQIQEQCNVLLGWLEELCIAEAQADNIFEGKVVEEIFTKKVAKINPLSMNQQAFSCFRTCFLVMNQQAGKLLCSSGSVSSSVGSSKKRAGFGFSNEFHLIKLPKELSGLSCLWDVVFNTRHQDTANGAITLLYKIYQSLPTELQTEIGTVREEYIQKCTEQLEKSLEAKDIESIDRVLSLLEALLDQTEIKGNAGLQSHSARLRGVKVCLKFRNELYRGNLPKNFDMDFYANATIWDVRCKIARRVHILPDIVSLTRNGKEIEDLQNSKTLAEIRIKSGEILTASTRSEPYLRQVPLLTKDKKLVPAARAVFTTWFESFSQDGLMDRDGAARFIDSCLHDKCQPTDPRVDQFFTRHDHDKDGFLTLEDFLELYTHAVVRTEHIVWNNLRAHGYDNQLRKIATTAGEGDYTPDTSIHATLPRFILSSSERNFGLLVRLVDIDNIKTAERVWRLLMRLPTNPEIQHRLWSLESVKTPDANWNTLLDNNSVFRLLYALQIVEGWVETIESGDSSKEKSERAEWRQRFLLSGGFHHLYSILMSKTGAVAGPIVRSANSTPASSPMASPRLQFPFSGELQVLGISMPSPTEPKLSAVQLLKEKCLSLVLKIFGFFLLGALSVHQPDLIKTVQLVRQSSSSADPLVPAGGALSRQQSHRSEYSASSSADIPYLEDVTETGETAPPMSPNSILSPRAARVESVEVRRPSDDATTGTSADFGALVKQLSGKLSNMIKDKVDYQALQERLIELAADAAVAASATKGHIDISATDSGSEFASVAENALSLWVGCILHDIHLLDRFYALPGLKEKLSSLLLCSAEVRIRREIAHSIDQISSHPTAGAVTPHPRDFFSRKLLEILPDLSKSGLNTSGDQFFDILSKLVGDACIDLSAAANQSAAAAEKGEILAKQQKELLIHLIENFKSLPYTEKNGSSKADSVLVGYLKLITTIITYSPTLAPVASDLLINELFADHLFAQSQVASTVEQASAPSAPKCKTETSRKMAFALLTSLCKADEKGLLSVLRQHLPALKSKAVKPAQWAYSPNGAGKSITGFVGLKNLGNTCYMNSVLQQCFMIPWFRYGVWSTSGHLPEEDKQSSLLHQVMFGFLSVSERQQYDPSGFCHSYRDWDGNPIDVSQQQDAQQFMLRLFDILEFQSRKNKQPDFVKALVGGSIANQMQYGSEKRERLEDYYCVSLEVKNSKDVFESLDKFVQPTIIQGYNWDDSHKGVDIKQRNCFHRLGSYLILHLNRFTINFDTFTTEKLNSRFAFPLELNMEPYTSEGLAWRESSFPAAPAGEDDILEEDAEMAGMYAQHPKEYYEYELAGVVVHSGTANSGHYYSYIKTTPEESGEGGKESEGKWLRFDDQVVSFFDIADLDKACFGGSGSDADDNNEGFERSSLTWESDFNSYEEKINNAYLLFYRRKSAADTKAEPLRVDTSASRTSQTGHSTSLPLAPSSRDFPERGLQPRQPIVAVPSSSTHIASGSTAASGPPTPGPKRNHSGSVFLVSAALSKLQKGIGKYGHRDIPPQIFELVSSDNSSFTFERHIFHPEFYQFVTDLYGCLAEKSLSILDPSEHLHTIVLGLTYAVDIFARAHNGDVCFLVILKFLRDLLMSSPKSISALLSDMAESPSILSEQLLKCPDVNNRKAFSAFISAIASHACGLEAQAIVQLLNGSPGQGRLGTHQPVSIAFLSSYLALLDEAAEAWPRLAQYAQFFDDFCSAGDLQAVVLISLHSISKLVHFVLGEASPIKPQIRPRTRMGNNLVQPKLDPIVNCVSRLVQCVNWRGSRETEKGDTSSSEIPQQVSRLHNSPELASLGYQRAVEDLLIEEDKLCVTSAAFYEHCISRQYSPKAVLSMIEHCSWENQSFTDMMTDLLLRLIAIASIGGPKQAESLCSTIRLAGRLLGVDDTLQDRRVAHLIGGDGKKGGIVKILFDIRYKFEYVCLQAVDTFQEAALENEVVLEYLRGLQPLTPHEQLWTDWIFFLAYRMGCSAPRSSVSISSTVILATRVRDQLEEMENLTLDPSKRLPPLQRELDMSSTSIPIAEDATRIVRHRETPEGVVVQVVERIGNAETGEAPKFLFEVVNNRSMPIRFSLSLMPTPGDPPNFPIPAEQLSIDVIPNTAGVVYEAEKLDPRIPWGLCPRQYAFKWIFNVLTPQAPGSPPRAPEPLPGLLNEDDEDDSESNSANEPYLYDPPTDETLYLPPPPLEQGKPIACPTCTFDNEPTRIQCEMCDTPLPNI